MAQTAVIVDALKKALKEQGKTYADVAQALDLAEASVRRLFSERSFSLKRLDQICQLIDLEISDLVGLLGAKRRYVSQLSDEAEHALVADLRLLLVAIRVLNNWSFQDLVDTYVLSETEIIQLLAKLDKLKMIELLPKIKLNC